MKITILYFAQLRELAGKTQETIETSASTPAALYHERATIYAFPLATNELRVAINDTFADMTQTLNTGDEIAFIPPVSGG